MKIDFDTGRISQSGASQPVAKQDPVTPASDTVSLSTSASLNSQLNKISTVRPEQVARAADLLSDGQYPSNGVLDRIAGLFAGNMQGGDAGLPGQTD